MTERDALPRPFRILFSPKGIAGLALIYLLVGLLGHDPWRGDDARYFGPIFSMLQGKGWLVPSIAGGPYLEFPPLYYWVGACTAWLTSPILPFHDGARLASAVFCGLTLFGLSRAATRLYGRQTLAPASLLTLGTLGLVVHAHETQPLLATMAGIALTFAGLAGLRSNTRLAWLEAGIGGVMAILSGGLPGAVLVLPLLLHAIVTSGTTDDRAHRRRGAILALSITVALPLAWAAAVLATTPDLAHTWWRSAGHDAIPDTSLFPDADHLAQQLSWFLWPLWPIAGWALWRARRRLTAYEWVAPLIGLASSLLVVIFIYDSVRPANLLPLIPSTALLAAAGVSTLRRGAANAFDWFAVMCFFVFGLLIWTAWSAMANSWPPGLARQLVKLAPAFRLETGWVAPLAGLIIFFGWIALVWATPRSPNRGPTNWATGMTMLWCLTTVLLLPWFDYGKSYRPAADSLAAALAHQPAGCIAGYNVSQDKRASLDYFGNVVIRSLKDDHTRCNMLLVYVEKDTVLPAQFTRWTRIWEFRRGGGRQLEILRLYKRD